ncbi:MAG: hypothetical protein ABWY11_03695, partial [Umezawaea sp.]
MDPGRRERRRSDGSSAAGAGHPLLEDAAVVGDVLLTGRLSSRSRAWLGDQVVRGGVPLPGEVFLELALWAGRHVGSGLVEELTVEDPLSPPESGSVDLRVRVGAEDGAGRRGLAIHSRAGSPSWTRRATGVLGKGESAGVVPPLEWPPFGAEVLDPGRFGDPEVGLGPVLR